MELVRAFVNTYAVDLGTDELDTRGAWHRWLVNRGLLPAGARLPTEPERQRALALREALRGLLGAHNGLEPEAGAPALLAGAADRAKLTLRFEPDGSGRLEPTATGFDAALGRIVAAAYQAQSDGTWPRLKTCHDETCRWSFYDSSKNGSRTWCNMDVCGNRCKVRLFRARALS
ncbi:MAG: CGNR zinc finger domain-containing protein [Candidatus Baltobacteraceae bacterium]